MRAWVAAEPAERLSRVTSEQCKAERLSMRSGVSGGRGRWVQRSNWRSLRSGRKGG